MKIECKDGQFQVPEQLLAMSQLVRDFCNSQVSLNWAKEQSVETVYQEMQELMWK